MAEVIAITAVALAIPPCVNALTKIMVKIAAMLHLSSPAQCTYILSRVRRLINQSRAELEKGSGSMSPEAVKEYRDKLNKAIDLYNHLVTSHSAVNPKIRLDSLKTAQKASVRLLKDIKICSRKCADEKLMRAVKTCLDYDQNIESPDGTIAAYHSDGNCSHDLPPPSDATVAHTARNGPGPVQAPPILPLLPASESIINTPMSSPLRFYIPVEIHILPHVFSSSSHNSSTPQNPPPPSVMRKVIGTTAAEDNVTPIDLGTTSIS
ncbi:hypothetical protein DL96DRAFT_1686428 [Flagelloscypha sp. PMI_526]|nr:hypothetical protein DL96DRAFT_1686428 [Flagelloscypha sp. PMI_526]